MIETTEQPRPKLSEAKRALLERRLRGEGLIKSAGTIPVRKSAQSPLSSAQERLWFLEQLEPNSLLYTMPGAFRLSGPLDSSALEAAIKKIVDRHQVLRTRFTKVNGEPMQVVGSPGKFAVEIIEVGSLENEKLHERVLAEAQRPFDLASDLMVRATLFRLTASDHVLLLNMHHIASDRWSWAIFLRELTTLYDAQVAGGNGALATLPIQYSDYAIWQREQAHQAKVQEHLAYWRRQLEGAQPLLELPTDHPRPAVQSSRGSAVSLTLPRELWNSLNTLARSEGATPFLVLLTAFKVLLHRYTRREDLLVGVPLAGRKEVETESLIGLFINTLAIRTGIAGQMTFRQALQHVKQVVLDAHNHQDIPFERLVEELRPIRNQSFGPLVQVMFAFQNTPPLELKLRNIEATPIDLPVTTSKFDLTLFAEESKEGLRLTAEYCTALFEPETMTQLLRNFEVLLGWIASQPDEIVSRLPLDVNGKVNRSALPALNVAPTADKQFVPPNEEAEIELAKIWGELLTVKQISRTDNFFDLGGHSLLAIRVLAMIEKRMGKTLPVAKLFESPTLQGLAQAIRESGCPIAGSTVVPIQSEGTKTPLFLVHGAGGGMHWGYANLAHHLGVDQPIYAFKSPSADNDATATVEKMAARYVDDLRAFQPHGPYYLGGYCFGGNVAYEMARQLEAGGERVALLVLMNSIPTRSRYRDVRFSFGWLRKFAVNINYLLQWHFHRTPTQQREFVKWQARTIAGKIRRWFAPKSIPGTDASQLVDLASYSPEERAIWDAHVSALFKYRTLPYAGRTMLLRSRGHQFWCSFDASYGWSDFVKESLEVRCVPGAHEQILEEPHVRTLAEELKVALIEPAPNPPASKSHAPVTQALTETQLEYPRTTTLVQLFEAAVERAPDETALVAGDTVLTYRELNACANQVAHHLRAHGVGPEALVAICVERSWRTLAGILGILKAGGAYVPMDPAYPRERLEFMLADARCSVVLTEEKLLPLFQREGNSLSGTTIVRIDSDWEQISRCSTSSPEPTATASNLAYVIYTSGSTGRPKGVAIEHRAPVALMHWARTVFSDEEISGTLAATSICFDLSIFEMFVPLSWNGTVIMVNNALALLDLRASSNVTLVNTVPSAARELLRVQGIPDSVRVVNLAGEPLSTELADQIYKETSAVKVYDLYGPSETTTYSTFALRQRGEAPTIGQPLANEQVYILDENLKELPAGETGELYIGGDGLARGYLFQPELTAQRFIPNPFKAGERMYKTGDLARWRPDGKLEFLGRTDHQVKIRGFRIELGEIESVLRQHPQLAEVVVIATEHRAGDKRLSAYLVARSEQQPSANELRSLIKTRLPEYMVPSDFVYLAALPLTPNGKIDRKALPSATPVRQPENAADCPGTATEAAVAKVWREVLGLEHIGVHDNFFEIGGHSLLAIQIISRIRAQFKVDVPLFSLFDSPSVHAISERLTSGEWPSLQTAEAPLEPVSRSGPLPVSFVQERLWFLNALQPDSDAYNVPFAIRLKGRLNPQALERALKKIVERHEILRTTFAMSGEDLTQIIQPRADCPIRLVDLCSQPASEREALARAEIEKDARRPFDLSRLPLIRLTLARIDDTDHLLGIVMHHAISDGWSIAILFEELGALYNAFAIGKDRAAVPELRLQYADYAAWQRRAFAGSRLESEVSWWKKTLEGAPSAIQLPKDSVTATETGEIGRERVHYPANLSNSLNEFCHKHGCTPFMVFTSALALALQKWTKQSDLVIGTVVAGRNHQELESIIGCFMNFLPLRINLNEAGTGTAALSKTRATIMEAQNHQDCPFQKIVEAVNPKRRANANPLYNVALLMQNFPAHVFKADTLRSERMPVDTAAALLDLRFEAEEIEKCHVLNCEYRTTLFARGTIQQLLASFQNILETLIIQPDRALADFRVTPQLEAQAQAARDAAKTDTIAVTATFTADFLAEPLRYWMKELKMSADVEFAPYSQVFQELLDPNSLLGRNQSGLNVVLVRLEDWQTPGATGDRAASSASLDQKADELVDAIKAAVTHSSTPHLVCFCPSAKAIAEEPSSVDRFDELENRLARELETLKGVQTVTSRQLFDHYPVADHYDPRSDELGHVPYTPAFFAALATMLARRFHAIKRPPCKVIALDCDQTLWSGICGEDGPSGIAIDEPRRVLQEFMRGQLEAGRLLCLCSKNNEDDVLAVFNQRSDLPLQSEHFVARQINWNPKSANLRALAAELNVGIESFVLVDDNPVECAEVSTNCPEMVALQLPDNPEAIPQFLKHCWIFDHQKSTAEDAQRTALYQQNRQREASRREFVRFADFLESLELKISIERLTDNEIARVAQLTQRTNQFNAVTRPRTEMDIRNLMQEPDREMWTVHVSDRFGDYGLVGTMMLKRADGALFVDGFFLSCRALGKGVEHRMLAHLGRQASQQGRSQVRIKFIPSAKNKPAHDFLESVGGQFRQALNGGFVYDFPVEVAESIAFQPAEREQPVNNKRLIESTSASSTVKFDRWQWIATQANDADRILRAMNAQIPMRVGISSGGDPATKLEKDLCEIWQELLHMDRVGIHDDFFALGGHSVLAVRLFARIETLTGKRLPVVTIFQSPTIAQLARCISDAPSAHPASTRIVPIQPHGTRSPLFLVHGAGGDAMWGYANLAQHLGTEQPVYGIQTIGPEEADKFETLEAMAAHYIKELLAFQPIGPYCLGGYCFGGNLAYEMARQLDSAGHEVAFLALLESTPEGGDYERVFWWRPSFIFRFIRNFYFCIGDFYGYTALERRSLVRRKLKVLARKLFGKLRRSNSQDVDLDDVIDASKFSSQEIRLWDAHLRLLAKHTSKPYSKHVTVFRTTAHPLFSSYQDDLGWGSLAKNGVTVKVVAGSHGNIFVEPNVKDLAENLKSALPAICPARTTVTNTHA